MKIKNDHTKFRFIFVGGCGRSGTTLAQKLLVAHSNITGGPEFDYTEEIFLLYKKMYRTQKTRQDVFYDQEELTRIFRSFFRSMFVKLSSSKSGVHYVSEKTPRNIFVSDVLLEVFPDSVFINIVRDGRDVVVSHRDVNKRYKKITGRWQSELNLYNVCRLWNQAVDKYFAIIQNPEFYGRIINMKYEDLTSTPKQEISRIVKMLGLEMELHLLNPEYVLAEEIGFKADNTWYTQEMLNQPINRNKIGRWKKDLLLFHRLTAEILMARNLERLGYSVSSLSLKLQNVLSNCVKRVKLIRKLI